VARRGDVPTRAEVGEGVTRSEDDLKEQWEEVEKPVSDNEVIADVLDSLEGGGSAEGADSAEGNIEAAQEVSSNEFEEESRELEQIQDENSEVEDDLKERSDSASSDAEKIRGARDQVNSDAANRELSSAEDEELRDQEFLDEQADRALEAREESKRLHEEHEARVNAARST